MHAILAQFFQHFAQASGSGSEFFFVALGFALVAALLLARLPQQRKRVGVAILLFVAALLLLLAAAGISIAGAEAGQAYRWTRFVAQLLLAIAIINVVAVLLFHVILSGLNLRPPAIVRDLLIAGAYLAAFLSLLGQAGVNLTGIVATSAVMTAVIGFSLQDTLANIMGGMAVQLDRSIAAGDWIRIGEGPAAVEGKVILVRWRHTAIETRNWDTVLIPNSLLTKSQVTVLGKRTGMPRQRRQWVYFNVDFRHAPTRVIDIVESALRASALPTVAADPAPHCLMTDFKDSYATYAARYWLTDLAVNDGSDSQVRARIFSALQRAGISPSIPAQSVFVTEEDSSRRQRKTEAELLRKTRALAGVELFAPLTEEEKKELAEKIHTAPFVRGESIVRQGQSGDWLYILASGSAQVQVATEDGKTSRTVATLHAGDFFGEMGLLTGGGRSATVVAQSDATCYRVEKGDFTPILERRPQIAEEMAKILARRKAELDAAREGLNEEAMRRRMTREQGDLLHRIRRFFTLE